MTRTAAREEEKKIQKQLYKYYINGGGQMSPPRMLNKFKITFGHIVMSTKLRNIIMSMGIDLYLPTEDRRVLETVIMPYFVKQSGFKKILFVGCDWYTRGYKRFFRDKEFWTLEIDPAKRKYGSKRHIIDSVVNMGAHFHKDELDLIICNGVFGDGLDAKPDVEEAFRWCYECIRPGGVFILGWNNIPERTPFALEDSESLRLFKPYVCKPLGVSRVLTPGLYKHIYDFFLKP